MITTEQTYRGYTILHRSWLRQRPWRCQVPDDPARWSDCASLAACQHFIDRRLRYLEHKKNG